MTASLTKASLRAPEPPSHLGEPGRTLWQSLVAEYGICDTAGLALVTSAAECADTISAAQAAIRRDGLTVKGAQGQVRAHPCAAIERDARSGLLAALKALNLDVEPLKPPGRPPAFGMR